MSRAPSHVLPFHDTEDYEVIPPRESSSDEFPAGEELRDQTAPPPVEASLSQVGNPRSFLTDLPDTRGEGPIRNYDPDMKVRKDEGRKSDVLEELGLGFSKTGKPKRQPSRRVPQNLVPDHRPRTTYRILLQTPDKRRVRKRVLQLISQDYAHKCPNLRALERELEARPVVYPLHDLTTQQAAAAMRALEELGCKARMELE